VENEKAPNQFIFRYLFALNRSDFVPWWITFEQMPIFRKIKHLYLGFFALYLLVGCSTPDTSPPPTTFPSSIYTLNSPDNYRLRDHLQILPDAGYSIEDITQPELQGQFVPYPNKTFEPQSDQVYWGKIQLENRLPDSESHTEWVLNFTGTFTHLTLYRLAENGEWASEVNGVFVPAKKKNFTPTNAGNWFKLALPPSEVVTLYFQGKSERTSMPPTFHAYVQPLATYYDKLVDAKTGNALFTGFLLMMLLYNLIKFFIVRDRSYIYYSGYLLMVVVYTAYSSDDLEDWIGGFVFEDHPAYFNLFKISLYLGLMCWLAFIRRFLDLEQMLPKWDRYFQYVIWLGVPLMVIFVFLAFRYHFNYEIDDRLTLFYIALATLSGFLFIYPLLKTKDPKGYFIAAGIAVLCLGFLLTLFSRMAEMGFTVNYLKVCTIVEILVFSLGLAYRQKRQVEEKQQADFALRESQLLQEKNQVEADRLQELNDFKSRFFTNITHEFRTPLTVILGMAEQLQRSSYGVTSSHPTTLIKRNGESLLRLINQLLDLAKLESNTLKINYIQGDVLTYLKYIAESLHSFANAQNIMLRVESDQPNIVMDYDPERFLQIIHNLLSNAIKFTPSGGKVIMRADVQGHWLLVSVTDSGAGIPADEVPHLFERFFQAKNQEHAKASGTGIGLSLTYELVKAKGGSISVESEVGVGSTFLVKLPVTNKAALSDGMALEPKLGGSFKLPPNMTPPDLTSKDAPHILLIEDNPDVVEYLTACLENSGGHQGSPYRLDFAYNGKAGTETALDSVPDLIISDVMMPIKDGFEVLETLKNDERTSHIPIILLTAKADVESRLSGLRRGADAYLSKPFNQEELRVTVDNLLELRRKLQARYSKLEIGKMEIGKDSNFPISQFPISTPPDPEDAFLQKFRSVVEANLSDTDFEMPQMERALAMSRSQIYRKVKALTGKSPSLFIRSIRMHHGRHLLLTTDLTVSEIAYKVGYSALNNFSDAFLEEFGERPMKARG
jgi:signal transduction histidine kinase/DNA-binding NarL/FixJ family response regulator